MNTLEMLQRGANQLGVALSDDECNKFFIYMELLKKWNNKFNLTSITSDADIVVKHFLDSLSILKFLRKKSRLLDIGSGAGFPGIPLSIADDSIIISLLDSSEKKVFFLKEVIRSLKLSNVRAINKRAEDTESGVERGAYDYVVSRAAGDIDRLLKISVPYINDNGKIILMRGDKGKEEWSMFEELDKNNFTLQAQIEEIYLPYGNYRRVILILKKGG